MHSAMGQSFKGVVLLLLMLGAAVLGSVLRPTISVADTLPPISLQAMVPKQFGDWKEDANGSGQVVDPSQQANLSKIYSEILSRVYVNAEGYRIMLSIAYGKNQNRNLQLHRPESCYPSQGFQLLGNEPATLAINGIRVPAVRLKAKLGQRIEPIIYWALVGDKIAATMTEKRLIEVRYAMRGLIPDGMLVRVSSIDTDAAKAYLVQEKFASDLVAAIAPESRSRFAGSVTTAAAPNHQ